jgi:hypothetical protein
MGLSPVATAVERLIQMMTGANLDAVIVAGLLALAVLLAIHIGRALLFAAFVAIVVGCISLGQGQPLSQASSHAAVAFGAALLTVLLGRLVRGILIWLVIAGLGTGALVFALRQ